MSKTTVTIDDLIKIMMTNDNTLTNCLKAFDPDLKTETLYYHHQRLLFHYKTNGEKITVGEAAAIMLKEEGVTDMAVALAMFGYCNFRIGRLQGEQRNQTRDDIISKALDKLATELGGKLEIVKVDINDKSNRSENDQSL